MNEGLQDFKRDLEALLNRAIDRATCAAQEMNNQLAIALAIETCALTIKSANLGALRVLAETLTQTSNGGLPKNNNPSDWDGGDGL